MYNVKEKDKGCVISKNMFRMSLLTGTIRNIRDKMKTMLVLGQNLGYSVFKFAN